jgi:hypothetical protein
MPQDRRSSRAAPFKAGNLDPTPALAPQPDVSVRVVMSDNSASNGKFGAILGALIAVVVLILLLNGGEHVGKKTINSDDDLPPVATGTGKSK